MLRPFSLQANFGSPTYTVAESVLIFNAFRDFVQVHQQLLNILIGKAGLFQVVPFIGAPIASALRQVEKIVDTIAFSLFDACQTQAANIQSQAGQLKMTLNICISKYDGLIQPIQPGGRKMLSVTA